jgi:hypothetical protein
MTIKISQARLKTVKSIINEKNASFKMISGKIKLIG